MKDVENEKYWENIDKKADSIIELLRGISCSDSNLILNNISRKIKEKMENTIL